MNANRTPLTRKARTYRFGSASADVYVPCASCSTGSAEYVLGDGLRVCLRCVVEYLLGAVDDMRNATPPDADSNPPLEESS